LKFGTILEAYRPRYTI